MTICFRQHMLALALMSTLAIGCGEAADDESAIEAEEEATAEAEARATGPQSAQATQCAVQYAGCLLGAWSAVLTPAGLTPLTKCTQQAEQCGLFDGAPDSGTGLAPSCGFEIADCYLKNPKTPSKCRLLPCRATGDAGVVAR